MASNAKRTITCLLVLIFLLPFIPTVSADDDAANANILTSGSTSSNEVDEEGDAVDWWRIDILGGDTLTIDVSSSTGDHGWDWGCFATDHWEGKVKIWDSNAVSNLYTADIGSDGSRSVSISIVPSATEWGSITGPTTYFTEVRSQNTCDQDEFNYDITAIIDTTFRKGSSYFCLGPIIL